MQATINFDMKRVEKIVSVIFLMALLINCEKNNDPPTEPKLIFSQDTMVFNDLEPQSLFITTKPATECTFQIISFPDWISVQPMSGRIYRDISEITITPQMDNNTSGIFNDPLIIMSTYGSDTVVLKGYFVPQLPDFLKFSVFDSIKSFYIVNKKDVSIDFVLTSSNEFISFDITSGSISAAGIQKIDISAVRENMLTDTYNSMAFVTINEATDTIHVEIEHFKEQKKILESEITDAEFSLQHNELIFVSSNPLSLTVYDVSDNSYDQVSLSYIPICVSVASDGNHAVVGHDGKVSYIDLINRTVIKAFDVPCNVSDIALGDNNWAYAIPADGSHVRVQCINLSDNSVVPHLGNLTVYEDSKIKIHPSGKFIYLADNGVSPSDLRKLDIQNDTAYYLYDSPYHGDYPSGEDLWFSEDGVRIFTRATGVFKTSELQSQDMLYNGKITLESTSYGYNTIPWLVHSESNNKLYILSTGEWYDEPNKPYVYIYNATNLVYESKIELEKYLVPDGFGTGNFYDSAPYFVFCNSAGTNIYVLTKALESGLLYEWALQEYTIE
jgi:hypothetical protein